MSKEIFKKFIGTVLVDMDKSLAANLSDGEMCFWDKLRSVEEVWVEESWIRWSQRNSWTSSGEASDVSHER